MFRCADVTFTAEGMVVQIQTKYDRSISDSNRMHWAGDMPSRYDGAIEQM